MIKFSLTMLACCAILSGSAVAGHIIVGSGPQFTATHLTGTNTWTNNNTYQIKGWVFVDSLSILVIEPGTIVYGDKPSLSALIIRRGAKIIADGTVNQPILFTSFEPAGARAPGDWGGLIILGSATTNKPVTQQIEGGFTTNAPGQTFFGGSNDDDSSGVLRYVRIEYPGSNFGVNDEINGLTLGGVGRKTKIEYVQVSYSNDDDFEFFGGTVDAKYIIGWRTRDDDFDTDFGYNGRIQFGYVKRDVNLFGLASGDQSNGFESDNEAAAPFLATPRTKARVSNMTMIGPFADVASAAAANLLKWQHEALIRRSSELSIYNSVLAGWPFGPQIRDTTTQSAAANDRLEIRNTSVGAAQGTAAILDSTVTTTPAPIFPFSAMTWFNAPGKNNLGSTPREWGPGSGINFTAAAFTLGAGNNPVPGAGSELATAGSALDGRLTGDPFFTATTYRGAFDPAVPIASQWTAGWANFAPENSQTTTTPMTSGWNLVSVPHVPASFATSTLFPTVVPSTVNSFLTGAYTQPATLVNGEGYWAFYSGPASNTITGDNLTTASVVVATGNRWVLVGSVSSSKPASALTSTPPGAIVGGTLYGWNGTVYTAATTLEPGKGYWVFVNAPCTLTIN